MLVEETADMSGDFASEFLHYKAAVFAAFISSVCLAILLITIPALYVKVNNAQDKVTNRMVNFRV